MSELSDFRFIELDVRATIAVEWNWARESGLQSIMRRLFYEDPLDKALACK